MSSSHPVARFMDGFFHQYLAVIRGLSDKTILAYRDAIKLLLCFAADRLKRHVDKLNIEDFGERLILAFLDHVQKQRRCSTRTRNARLARLPLLAGRSCVSRWETTQNPKRSPLHKGSKRLLFLADSRRWLRGQFKFKNIEQEVHVTRGFGVASQQKFASIGGGDPHVEHLHGREFLKNGARH